MLTFDNYYTIVQTTFKESTKGNKYSTLVVVDKDSNILKLYANSTLVEDVKKLKDKAILKIKVIYNSKDAKNNGLELLKVVSFNPSIL